MRQFALTVVLVLFFQEIIAPPVTEKKEKKENEDKNERFEEMGIEYNRYLVQVVEALESDPDFRKKLENATSDDIQSGKIAEELDFVSHNVRTKLDELKRIELDRLRSLARQVYEVENDIDTAHLKIAEEPGHVDHTNPHTFEIADLKKLIAKTSEDLAEADNKRREEFKTYEMEKEFEKQQKLKELDEEKKKRYLEELEAQKQKHKKHDPLHHPGSKQQLEEVWEKQDHMENQEFDPKAFFYMHDLDGNGVWDESEVKALFLKELDKLYEAGSPEDDMRERAEEMERMREHVFREADVNHDNLISFEEFLQQTKKPEFGRDPGWEPLDEQQLYTQDEYREFEQRREQEIQRLIQEGKLQPPPVYHAPPPHMGYHPQPQGYNQVPPHVQQVPYEHQAQAYQQHQTYQQQQQFQQQRQNTMQKQQDYHQKNPPHYQQQNQQYQQPQQQQYQPPQNQPPQQNQQYQQPPQNQQYQQAPQNQQYQQPQQNQQYQQPQLNQQQYQPPQQNQQYQQPQLNQQQYQPPQQNQQQQQQPQQNQQQQQQPQQNQQFQQPLSNQQPPQQQQPPSPAQQPLSNSIPLDSPQQPSNNIPNAAPPNVPITSNEIPKLEPVQKGPPPPVRSNSIPSGPK